jgi:carboxyl-terminal processing protease
LDPYSDYIAPEQLDRFKTGVESEFGGVGIQVSIENGLLRVISPLVGSPAYRAGMLADDLILEIDGKATKGINLEEAVRRMKGAVGTKVTLKVQHADKPEPESMVLERENVRMQTVMGDTRNGDDSWHWMYDDEKKIGYVRITGFGRHTAEELQAAMKALTDQKMRGLILDLRFNPGGLLTTAIEVSDLFVAKGKIVSVEGRNTQSRSWEAQEKDTYDGFPMAVLVNRFSASASEIVAACLQDHNRATIVGERTWGKGTVQNVIEMERGTSALKLTTAAYHRPNGKSIHRFPDSKETDEWGVAPNEGFEVKLSPPEIGKLMSLRRDKDVLRKPNGPTPPADSPTPPADSPTPPADNPTSAENATTGATLEFVDPQLQRAMDCLQKKLEAEKPADVVTAKAAE